MSEKYPKLCENRSMPAWLSKAFRRFESAIRRQQAAYDMLIEANESLIDNQTFEEAVKELGDARAAVIRLINEHLPNGGQDGRRTGKAGGGEEKGS